MNDKEQRIRKSIVEDFDNNMFVEAGAGAGKTQLIVDRIIGQLKSGEYKPKDIVVITFTNKAANELLDRIINGLRTAINKESGVNREHLDEALKCIEDMNISTIHSFCYKLLQENCFAARIPVGITLLEERELLLLEEKSFEHFLEDMTDEDWDKLLNLSGDLFVDERYPKSEIGEYIRSIYIDLCGLQKDIHIGLTKVKTEEEIKSDFKAYVDEFIDQTEKCIKEINSSFSTIEDVTADKDECFLDLYYIGTMSKRVLKDMLLSGDRDDEAILNLMIGLNKEKLDRLFKNVKKTAVIKDNADIANTIVRDACKAVYSSDEEKVDSISSAIVDAYNKMLLKTRIESLSDISTLQDYENCMKSSSAVDTIVEFCSGYNSGDDISPLNAALKKVNDKTSFFNGNAKEKTKVPFYEESVIKEANSRMINWLTSRPKMIERLLLEKYEGFYQCCVDFAVKARDEYFAKERPADMVGNNDLLNLTYDMFKENADIQQELISKYKCFYVDEFQDTDIIQKSFIWNMASVPGSPEKLRPGALFVVGDPKQSIYRFRGAEPKVYFETQKQMQGLEDEGLDTKVYCLNTNFRSNGRVLEWINHAYERMGNESPVPLISDEMNNDTKFVYEYMEYEKPLDPDATYVEEGGDVLAGVYHINAADGYDINGEPNSKQGKADENTVEDAKALVNLIQHLKLGEYKITRYEEKTIIEDGKEIIIKDPKPKQIEYKDFLIICAYKVKTEIYLEEFIKNNIPVLIDGEIDPFNTKELKAFAHIYHYLSYKDSLSKVGATEALWKCGFEKSESSAREDADYILQALRDMTYDKSPYALAYELLSRFSLLVDKSAESTDYARLTAVKARLHQMVETVTSSCSGSRLDLADAFDKYVKDIIEHELSLKQETDAVRIMNIHKAKGLQGEIVILADRRGRTKGINEFGGGIIDGVYYPAVNNPCRSSKNLHPHSHTKWTAVSSNELWDRYLYESKCENHRLEYVTATRAAQALIFMDVIEPGNLFAEQDFVYGIDDPNMSLNCVLEKNISGNNGVDGTTYVYDNENVVHNNEEIHKTVLENHLSPSAFEKYKVADTDNDSIAKAKEAMLVRPVGKDFGTQMHKMLELLVGRIWINEKNGNTVNEEKLLSFCVSQAMELPIVDVDDVGAADESEEDGDKKNYSPEVVQKFLMFVGRAFMASLKTEDSVLKDAEEIYTELPFSFCYNNGDGIRVWLNGEADLVVKKKDGSFLLVDYKSDGDDKCTEDSFVRHLLVSYTPQLAEYKRMIVEVFKADINKIESRLVSFSQKDESGEFFKVEKVRVRYTEVDS